MFKYMDAHTCYLYKLAHISNVKKTGDTQGSRGKGITKQLSGAFSGLIMIITGMETRFSLTNYQKGY